MTDVDAVLDLDAIEAKGWCSRAGKLPSLLAEVRGLRQQRDAVIRLHIEEVAQTVPLKLSCAECLDDWPCPTVRILVAPVGVPIGDTEETK